MVSWESCAVHTWYQIWWSQSAAGVSRRMALSTTNHGVLEQQDSSKRSDGTREMRRVCWWYPHKDECGHGVSPKSPRSDCNLTCPPPRTGLSRSLRNQPVSPASLSAHLRSSGAHLSHSNTDFTTPYSLPCMYASLNAITSTSILACALNTFPGASSPCSLR